MRRFSYNIFLCCCWIPTLISALIPKKHIKHETMQPFNSLTKIAPSDGTAEHEVVIAITLKNLDLLENIVLDITNPDSPNFSKWMTTDEVNDLIKNEDALQNVTNWLDSNNVTITWRSLDTSYIKAVASISTWETLLHTKFYDWIDYRRNLTNGSHRPKMYRRSNDYSLPHDLTEHISAVFHTCQAPPLITHHAVHKPSSEQGRDDPAPIAGTGLSKSTMYVDPALLKARPSMREEIAVGSNTVTVGMLNNYYYIPFNSSKFFFKFIGLFAFIFIVLINVFLLI